RDDRQRTALRDVPRPVRWSEYRDISLAVSVIVGRNRDVSAVAKSMADAGLRTALPDVPGAVRWSEHRDVSLAISIVVTRYRNIPLRAVVVGRRVRLTDARARRHDPPRAV